MPYKQCENIKSNKLIKWPLGGSFSPVISWTSHRLCYPFVRVGHIYYQIFSCRLFLIEMCIYTWTHPFWVRIWNMDKKAWKSPCTVQRVRQEEKIPQNKATCVFYPLVNLIIFLTWFTAEFLFRFSSETGKRSTSYPCWRFELIWSSYFLTSVDYNYRLNAGIE